MRNQHRVTIATMALAFTWTAGAETVYKSVDPQGKVTYSSSPPADTGKEMVEAIPIAPGPTEEERREADQRNRELQKAVRQAEQQRREQAENRAETVSDAERELRNAEVALQETRIQGDDDWQYLATGGRVLKQSYLDRVAEAEQKVKEAEKRLRGARSGQP